MKFRFNIDEKSLFYGLYNDFKKGQSATISTPINQSKNPKKWRQDILQLYNSNLESTNLVQPLIDKCLNKTTSKANTKLVKFYEFKSIFIDGQILNCKSSFAIYIKEEIDRFITNKKGELVSNTHFGRLKIHYPISLKFNSNGFSINNAEVLRTILKQNGGFAFIVRGFECDTKTKSLNFITSLIGLEGTLLSTVFKKQKGVGKKLIIENDISNLDFANNIEPSNIHENYEPVATNINFDLINQSRIINGKMGEKYVIEHIIELVGELVEDVFHTSLKYPTSPYDIEYTINGIKKYIEVKSTSSSKEVFNMSSGEIKFMQKYDKNYILILVTNVTSNSPKTKSFTCKQILSLKKEFPSVRFYA